MKICCRKDPWRAPYVSLCLVILICVDGQSTSAADARFSSGKSALAIPFEIEDNLIYLNVSVNSSRPLSFILDRGAYTLVDLRRAPELAMDLKLTGCSVSSAPTNRFSSSRANASTICPDVRTDIGN